MIQGPPEGAWHYELITPDLYQMERVAKVLYSGETEYQQVEIIDGGAFGRS